MNKVISIQGLGKKYKLGTINSGTLKEDIHQWWGRLTGSSERYAQIGGNDSPDAKNDFWALRDVSFDVEKGETIGIIGKNGAGKSTLLKILSRVTSPTTGVINMKGRISSLLEVGTGFHPDLTGRANIFLNGAILGMTKREIKAKLDEIIDFSGVEKHIDTPVKRYSSGMHVRLAFAVAAYLEPEILVVDEVLAVGDAEFQRKCLGKMSEVAGEGRTILFVSHNMQAINNLCRKAIWLEGGHVREIGPSGKVIANYINTHKQHKLHQSWTYDASPGNELVRFREVTLTPELVEEGLMDIRSPLKVSFQFWNLRETATLNIEMVLFSYNGDCIFDVASKSAVYSKGIIEGECTIPGNFLNDGAYYLTLFVMEDTCKIVYELTECLAFELEDYRGETKYYDKWWGVVRPVFPFAMKQKNTVDAAAKPQHFSQP